MLGYCVLLRRLGTPVQAKRLLSLSAQVSMEDLICTAKYTSEGPDQEQDCHKKWWGNVNVIVNDQDFRSYL